MKYYLSIGSNLGDRKLSLDKAITFLKKIGNIFKVSSIYETSPVFIDAGAKIFFNIAVSIEINLLPLIVLKKIKEFEKKMGRNIKDSHNKPREIDIDILMVGDLILDTKILSIPHREMTKRAFVLVPLNEISPDLIHPVEKKPIKEILLNLKTNEIVKKLR